MFFRIFTVLPLAELIAFVIVARMIGWGPALLCCVLSAMIGGFLIWRQGLQTLFGVRTTAAGDGLGADEVFNSACLALAGVLLIIPGFLTDLLALALLAPRLRRKIWRGLTGLDGPFTSRDSAVIEGEYERVEEEKKALKDDGNGIAP